MFSFLRPEILILLQFYFLKFPIVWLKICVTLDSLPFFHIFCARCIILFWYFKFSVLDRLFFSPVARRKFEEFVVIGFYWFGQGTRRLFSCVEVFIKRDSIHWRSKVRYWWICCKGSCKGNGDNRNYILATTSGPLLNDEIIRFPNNCTFLKTYSVPTFRTILLKQATAQGFTL